MTALTVHISDAVREALEAAGQSQHKSAEQVASETLAKMVQVQLQLDVLRERAKRGTRKDFDAFLAKVPDAAPLPGDETQK